MTDFLQVYAGLKAVLFDMDGVLTSNSPFHEAAWKDVVQHYFQVQIEDGDTRIHGGRAHEILTVLLGRQVTQEEALDFHEHKEARYRELAQGNIQPLEGLHAYLNFLTSKGIEPVLVTSGGIPNVALVLDAFGLQETFKLRITGETVKNGKPHPEPYLTALQKLGITAQQALVHEDAPAGVRSGRDAGCRVIALETTTGAAELYALGAELVVQNFDQLLERLQTPQEV
ncbi:HAD family hydrolase [Deinococcus cellulosilyticus]|uniref:Hydrolase n=1 Tax=Deinococcus cellulosilyticus (strain DSM 18568 / NBRC 106333 / KACC 11606 / 5516J-15) TaxID=1223518 RepID=A0A511MVE1_DEIC1|nr:HAD-IA family hydrolase [Deinococcus cellulosilyticus]GEM44371.1 hydrolase [Deinococcus cellulosilyticus NBRC 106333 = KACC 11606]